MENCTAVTEVQSQTVLEAHLVLLVRRGTFTLTVGGHRTDVHEDQIAVFPRGSAVTYRKHGDPGQGHRLEYWMFFLTDEVLKEFAPAPHPFPVPEFPVTRPASPRLIAYLDSLRPYFAEPGTLEEPLVRLKLLELLFGLAAVDGEFLAPLFSGASVGKDFAALMEKNIATGLTLGELADLSGRSRSSFQRDFHAVFHTAPASWFRDQRIAKAKTLLTTTGLTVTEVCLRVGFESPSHFSRVFRQSTGQTPLRFRQESAPASRR